MAKELTLNLTGVIQAQYKKTGNSTITGAVVNVNQTGFQQTLINGTGDADDVVNLLYSARHAIIDSAGVTLDLTSLTDEFGDSISITTKKLLFIKNLAASGSGFELICSSIWATAINLRAQQWVMYGCALSNGMGDIPSSLAFTTASTTSFNFDILVAGIDD